MSLDAGNARACLTLLEGFFGAWTGSAVDAVRESALKRVKKEGGQKRI
jgi:hypothetical protein